MNVEVAASLLGVEVDASKDEVTAAFKTRSRLVHPDRVSGESEKAKATAEELMKQLNMAKEVLLKHIENPEPVRERVTVDRDEAVYDDHVDDVVEDVEEFETIEEQIERFRSERKEDISKARFVVRRLFLILGVNLVVLLVVSGVAVLVLLQWVAGWSWWLMLWSVLVVTAVGLMWRRVVVRFHALTYAVEELNDFKSVSRLEEKEYRKALKPDGPDGFLGKLKRLFNSL